MNEEIAKNEHISRHCHQSQDDEIVNLREIFLLLNSKKKFIALVMAIMLLFSILHTLKVTPVYQTTALIQIDNKAEGMSSMLSSLDSSLGSFIGGSRGSAIPSEIESALIKSRYILQPVIESLGLNIVVRPKYFPVFGSYVAHHYHGEGLNESWSKFSGYAWGGERLHIKELVVPDGSRFRAFKIITGKDRAYKLYTSSGKFILEGIAGVEAIADTKSKIPNLRIFISDLQANPGVEFYVCITPAISLVSAYSGSLTITDLANMGSPDSLRSYSAQTGILNVSLKGTDLGILPTVLNSILYYDIERNIDKKNIEIQKTLSFLEENVQTLKADLDKASTALSSYKSNQGVFGVEVANRSLIDQTIDLQKSLEILKLRKAELLQQFTPQHPFVISVNEQQQKLSKELSQLESKEKALPQAEQQLLSLQRDVKVKSQLYLLMLSKIQELQLVKAATMSDVRILGLATPPVMLATKNFLSVFGSLIFGFMLAAAIIVIRHFLSGNVKDPDYIEERLGIPLYAILPYSKRQVKLAHEMKRKIPGSGPFVLATINSRDLAIEGLRSLRTNLQFGLHEAKNNVISILGSSPSIGKSFVSLNLAYVFADSGKKVLLIDADMRKGKISAYVSQSNAPGLAELLDGSGTLEQSKRVLKEGLIEFIPTGKYPENPSELLFDDSIQKLIDKLSPDYDIIIIDTPPVLAVTDSMLIAKHSGINLLLLGGGVENTRSLEHAVKKVHKHGIKIDGLIYNNAKQSDQTGYGYYYYDYDQKGKKNK